MNLDYELNHVTGYTNQNIWRQYQLGQVDIEILMKINEEIKKLHTNYTFKVDHGSFETAIEFTPIGYHHPPKATSWIDLNGNEIKCPDLLDWEHRRIIEYEEESKPGKKGGKLGKKGHYAESRRDSRRDQLYRISGFKVLKIWESDYKDGSYIEDIKHFLICEG